MNKKILIAQIEITSGDIIGNSNKIKQIIKDNDEVDFIVFPELTISGYNCGDLFLQKEFIDDCNYQLNEISKLVSEKTIVILGTPRYVKEHLKNSAAIINNGTIIDYYDKIHLANEFHHEDKKYFTSGRSTKTFYINGTRFSVLICEDIWFNDHRRNLVEECTSEFDLDVLFTINFSYFTFDKTDSRCKLLRSITSKYNFPVIYTNSVGVGDIIKNFMCYDGTSMVYKKSEFNENLESIATGFKIDEFKSFEEDVRICNVEIKENIQYTDKHIWNKYSKIYSAITYSLKKIFNELGIKTAQIHMSGGIDSAVVLYFAVQALGKENIICYTQPSKNNSSRTIGLAYKICENLGVKLIEQPIINYIGEYKLGEIDSFSNKSVATFEAVLRTALGLANCHINKSAILSTSNLTENTCSWFTYNDIGSTGILSVIGDLSKLEIYELCFYINSLHPELNYEILPPCLYDGSLKPAAELEDSNEDPFDYELYSCVCDVLVRESIHPKTFISDIVLFFKENISTDYIQEYFYEDYMFKKVKKLHEYNVEEVVNAIIDAHIRYNSAIFKHGQAAPNLILNKKTIGFSYRKTILNGYKYYDELRGYANNLISK